MIWNAATGELAGGAILQLLAQASVYSIGRIVYSPNGRRIAAVVHESRVFIWCVQTGSQIAVLTGHFRPIRRLFYTPDGRQIITGSEDGTIRVWDADSGRQLAVEIVDKKHVCDVVVSPDGQSIAIALRDKTILLWAPESNRKFVLRGHGRKVTAVAFFPDGKRIASGSRDSTIRFWDVTTGQPQELVLRRWSPGNNAYLSPDRQRFIGHGAGNSMYVWDLTTRIEHTIGMGPEPHRSWVSFSHDGRWFARGLPDQDIQIFDAGSNRQVASLEDSSRAHGFVFSPDSRRIAGEPEEHAIAVWETATGRRIAILRHSTNARRATVFAPNGRRIACVLGGLFDTWIQVWDLDTGASFEMRPESQVRLESIAFSSDGERIGGVDAESAIQVWDHGNVEPVAAFRGPYGTKSFAFSPDGRIIASIIPDRDGFACVWNLQEGRLLHILEGHHEPIQSIRFTADQRRIITVAQSETTQDWDDPETYAPELRVWSLETGECLETILGTSDIEAIAAGAERFPFGVSIRGQETVFERVRDRQVLGRFPAAFEQIARPYGARWAALLAENLYEIELAGDASTADHGL